MSEAYSRLLESSDGRTVHWSVSADPDSTALAIASSTDERVGSGIVQAILDSLANYTAGCIPNGTGLNGLADLKPLLHHRHPHSYRLLGLPLDHSLHFQCHRRRCLRHIPRRLHQFLPCLAGVSTVIATSTVVTEQLSGSDLE